MQEWLQLMNLEDSIYDILSTWTYIPSSIEISIDGLNTKSLEKVNAGYTGMIYKPNTIINLIDENGKLTLGGYIAIICGSSYNNNSFKTYLENRLLQEHWKKTARTYLTYYSFKNLNYFVDSVLFYNRDLLTNQGIIDRLEYSIITGNNKKNKYWEKQGDNIYKLNFYPVNVKNFRLYEVKPIEDNIYSFNFIEDPKYDIISKKEAKFIFKNTTSAIIYHWLGELQDKSFVTDDFKNKIQNSIIGVLDE